MKTLKQFLNEAVSKRSALSIFKKKMDHNNSIEELFSQTLREVFPNVHLTTNEQNNNLLHHLVNATKNVKLIQSLPNTFVTQNEIIKSSKFTIALDAHVEKDKCIVRHQFSIPEGKDFRDSEMTTLIESINRVISKCISLLSEISVNEIYINDKFEGNDILYTFTADAKTIKIANKEYLLFYIPKTVEEIEGNINLSKINLTRLPKYFPNVKGDFSCSQNHLTSLKGSPRKVWGDFYCYSNQLTSLEGGPEQVGIDYDCSKNKLTSLKGSPRMISRDFHCYDNQLTSLEGGPTNVENNFYCYNNKLTSLEGSPNYVGNDFMCFENNLISLKGSPRKIFGKFECHSNQLTSLKGSPYVVNGTFSCSENKLESLEGAPNEVEGSFFCNDNSKKFTEEEVKKVCKVKGHIEV